MLQSERRIQILEMLKNSRTISVKHLCSTLDASEATIRRDLALLEEEGKLERTHGGAILVSQTKMDYEESFLQKETRYIDQKRSIAQKAFSLLKENDSIILDAGTTTLELAKLIGQSDLTITVITNSTILSSELRGNPNLELLTLGGKVRLHTQATVGAITINTIRQFNVNKAFIAANGISPDHGPTTPDVEEAAVKNAMLNAASERYILVDHTKFNRVALCQIAPLSMFDAIITDGDVDPGVISAFEQREVPIILA